MLIRNKQALLYMLTTRKSALCSVYETELTFAIL